MDIPDFITHYHPAQDPPFRNLSDVPEQDRGAVISMLVERRRKLPGFHRVFGVKYIPMRLATEEKLRSLFVAAGGRPQRLAPHYFVLGASKWFEGLYPSTRKVVIPLADLDAATTSITFPDSFAAMRLGPDYGVPPEPLRPYHEQAFLLSDLPDLVASYGIPADEPDADYSNYAKEVFEKYIEVQVWDDAPVMKSVLEQ
ncbi:MAG: hypothetical protein RLO46_12565 [Pseudomonadales bacterium]